MKGKSNLLAGKLKLASRQHAQLYAALFWTFASKINLSPKKSSVYESTLGYLKIKFPCSYIKIKSKTHENNWLHFSSFLSLSLREIVIFG